MSSEHAAAKLSRREFAALGFVAPLLSLNPTCEGPEYEGGLTSIDGIRVGHDTLEGTGCTVVLTEAGATAGVDVRGSAPGTRETDLLNPVNTVDRVQAILLSGGSAFGLEAATGVVRYLEEKNSATRPAMVRYPLCPLPFCTTLESGIPGSDPIKLQAIVPARGHHRAPSRRAM